MKYQLKPENHQNCKKLCSPVCNKMRCSYSPSFSVRKLILLGLNYIN